MSSHLILLATAAAEPGENVSGVTKLLFDFGIDLPLLLAQILSFSVVAYLLWRFVFKPVMATLDDRQRQIESGLTYAEEMKAKLAQTKEDSTAILKQAQPDGAKLIEESRRRPRSFSTCSRRMRSPAPTTSWLRRSRRWSSSTRRCSTKPAPRSPASWSPRRARCSPAS